MSRPQAEAGATGWWAALVAVGLTVAVLFPVARGTDGFPLSNYPMFSKPKSTTAKVYHAVGLSPDGIGRPLSPEMVGTDEIMQAYQTVKLAIRGGASTADALCARAAANVLDDEDYASVTTVQLRVDVFESVQYWQGEKTPTRSRVVTTCAVPR
ncbi:MAG: hypothetical protein AAGA54_09685 [Myxococcota bacterium]